MFFFYLGEKFKEFNIILQYVYDILQVYLFCKQLS